MYNKYIKQVLIFGNATSLNKPPISNSAKILGTVVNQHRPTKTSIKERYVNIFLLLGYFSGNFSISYYILITSYFLSFSDFLILLVLQQKIHMAVQ